MLNMLEEAIIYATLMHEGSVRKFSSAPAILHSLEVAQILSTMTDDQEVITAGVLHDVVEDTDGSLDEIRKRFGDRVASIVSAETEHSFPGEEPEETWKRRKEESLRTLKSTADIGVKMLWLADKLSNIRSLDGYIHENGDEVWKRLNQKNPDQHLWYYRTVAEYVEMELNRTSMYKEFISHINSIWPGTFDSEKTRYRKYQEVRIDGCPVIGRGAKADIYRYTDDLVIKVYNEQNTYADVERETSLARKAFVLGLPTAISFGIVSVAGRYGAMFELVDASTISEELAKRPRQVIYYARIMADLARSIHATEVKKKDGFPNAKDELLKTVEKGVTQENPKLGKKLEKMVSAMPDTLHLIHGDFHTGNVFLQNGEPLFIDVDHMATGSPIIDLSGIYLFYVAFAKWKPKLMENYMGFSTRTAYSLFRHFFRHYLQTEDKNRIDDVIDKASLLAYIRFAAHLRKHPEKTEDSAETLKWLVGKIEELAGRVKNFDL